MLLTNHALTGAILGLSIDNELLLAPVAFTSHFALDAIPHFGDPRLGGWHSRGFLILGSIDFTIAIGVTIGACMLRPERIAHILLGILFATLPDLFYIPEILFSRRIDGKLRTFHSSIQRSETPFGLITEVCWFVGAVTVLLHLN